MTQGLTIGMRTVHTYAYFYWHMHDFGLVYAGTYAHFFRMIFLCFENSFGFYNFIQFKNGLLFDLYLFVPGRTDFLLFTFVFKKPYFSILCKNYLIIISPYLRTLASLGCQ